MQHNKMGRHEKNNDEAIHFFSLVSLLELSNIYIYINQSIPFPRGYARPRHRLRLLYARIMLHRRIITSRVQRGTGTLLMYSVYVCTGLWVDRQDTLVACARIYMSLRSRQKSGKPKK
jgi:hypothetical protein